MSSLQGYLEPPPQADEQREASGSSLGGSRGGSRGNSVVRAQVSPGGLTSVVTPQSLSLSPTPLSLRHGRHARFPGVIPGVTVDLCPT